MSVIHVWNDQLIAGEEDKTTIMKIQTVRYKIEGMTCDGCARNIERIVRRVEGVTEARVSYREGMGEFVFDPLLVPPDEISTAVNDTGHYRVAGEITEEKTQGNGKDFDLIIVGGGSAAFAAAIRADEMGLSVLMINDGLPTGGTCVNVGCVPSKTLMRMAAQVYHASHSPFAGVLPRGAAVKMPEIIREKRELVETLRQKKYIDILGPLTHVKFVKGRARFTGDHTVQVNEQESYRAKKFLIATGASTSIPSIPGLDQAGYLTHRTLFEQEHLPESLLILGGGYIALEIAQTWQRLGTQVTLLQRSPHVLSRQTADVAEEITRHLQDEGVEIHTGLDFQRVEKKDGLVRVTVLANGKKKVFFATELVIATGIRPNTRSLGADKAGMRVTDSGHIAVNDHLQTSVPHIYAAGDCIATPAYVYTAAYEGKLATDNAFTDAGLKADYTAMPWVVFTDPQVAGVGMDEKEAEAAGIPWEVSRVDLTDVPRSLAAFDTRGFVKLVRNPENDRLLGARIVAHEGSELTMELSLAIKYGIPVKELASSFHAYLTLSEAVKLAAIGFEKDVKTLSCCAV